MPDNLFDNFVGGKLKDHEAPVPNGLWDQLAEKQLDAFIGEKLKDHEAPVPAGLWDKIADAQLDNYFKDTLSGYAAPVPASTWDQVVEGPFDQFFNNKLTDHSAAVPAGIWDKIADGQFDQFVGDKLNNYTTPVPDGLWEKIHPEEKERRVIAWWRLPVAASFLLAMLIGGAMGAYFWFKPNKNDDKNGVAVSTGKPSSDKNTDPGTNHSTENAAKQNDAVTSPDASTIQPPVTAETPVAGLNSGKENDRNNITPSLSHSNAGLKRNGNGIVINGGHNTPFISTIDKNNITAQENVPPVNGDNTLRNDENNVASNIPFTLFSPGQTYTTGIKGIRLNQHNELNDNNHTSQFKSNVICPTNRRNGNRDLYLEVYASPDMAFRSISNNSASAQYLQKKDSSSQMNVGFTAGARIVKPITDNIWLKGGVQYTQMNERYVYRSENEIKTTTVVTVRTIIRAPGDTVVVSDTSVLQTAGYKNITVKNRYRSIDIPLTIGYQFPTEGDFRIGINAGVIFNLSSWYQGVILDSAMAVVPLTKSNDMIYKQKLGIGLYAGLSISKQLGEDMQIFCEPYFRYNLSNMTGASAPFNQRFSLGGLSVGLRFNLNRQ